MIDLLLSLLLMRNNMKISGTNKALVEIVRLLDPSFKCKCDPKAARFVCNATHDYDCLFEEELPPEYGISVRTYDIEYDGNKISRISFGVRLNSTNILSGTVR